MSRTTTGEFHMHAQPSARHWPDILWFLFVSAILGLTCGVAVGGAALLLATPAYGAESPAQASTPEGTDSEGEDAEPAEEEAPLVCTDVVLPASGPATVICRPRQPQSIQVRLGRARAAVC